MAPMKNRAQVTTFRWPVARGTIVQTDIPEREWVHNRDPKPLSAMIVYRSVIDATPCQKLEHVMAYGQPFDGVVVSVGQINNCAPRNNL
jgi:hypothetical protein